jgi:tRNA A37 methylthiotransferase MiaB
LVVLNTCSFISSGREEMFQTIEKLLSKKKKVCIIGCGVQYFEKLLKQKKSLDKGCKSELDRWEKVLQSKDISYLSWNDLSLSNLQSLTSRSKKFNDFCRYSAPRLLTNYENRYEYLKIAE